MSYFIYILIAIALISEVNADLKKEKVIVAINCGSNKPYKHSSGVLFSEDKFFKGGIESDYGEHVKQQWPDLPDLDVYYTERYTNTETLTYELPLKKGFEDGHYVLNLKFSEVYFDRKGAKMFNVELGSQTVVTDLDIFEKVGAFAPYDEFIEFDIKQKTVYYQNSPIPSAYKPEKNVVIVSFSKGSKDNPKVNGILLVRGTLADTEYDSYMNYFTNAEKLKLEKAEKLNRIRSKEIEKMLENDDDIDLSSVGQKYEKKRFTIATEKNPIKDQIKMLLEIPYGLELCSLAFVIIAFIIFTCVIYLLNFNMLDLEEKRKG